MKPLVMSWAMPRPATMRISVAMIGCTPNRLTSRPLKSPAAAATRIASTTAMITRPTEFWSEASVITRQATAPEMAMTAPTDRSMPPSAITTVMPRETSRIGVAKYRMLTRLPFRCPFLTPMEKNDGVKGRLNSSRATRISAGQNSWWRWICLMGGLRSRWSP